MRLTEKFAATLAHTLGDRRDAAQDAARRLHMMLDVDGSSYRLRFPLNSHVLNDLEQEAAAAIIETEALLSTLRLVREELASAREEVDR